MKAKVYFSPTITTTSILNLHKLLCLFLVSLLLISGLTGCAPASNTAPETTEQKTNALFQEDPADDGVLRLLMIGNSGCFYYTDELFGMFKAAGIKAEVYNLYYSGCDIKSHWEWLNDGSTVYELHGKTDAGSIKKTNYTLAASLTEQNWDVVTLQQAFWPEMTDDLQGAKDSTLPYAKNLFDHLKSCFPKAILYWHETWAYQVGFDWRGSAGPDQIADNMKVLTTEKQTAMYEVIRTVSKAVCEENSVAMVPVADAWQIARKDPAIGDVLCDKNNGAGDDLHDGDVGGGQYLNACVWFEFLAGQSCIGNTFRPSYPLSEEKIIALQKDAHQAVEDLKK